MLGQIERAAFGALGMAEVARAVGPRFAVRHKLAARAHAAAPRSHGALVYERIWEDAAAAVGAEATPLEGGILELRRGDAATRVWRNVTELDDPVTLRLGLQRLGVHRLLGEAGLPVPEHLEYTRRTIDQAAAFVHEDGPVVIKPAAGTSSGVGITCGVESSADLLRATAVAARFGGSFVAERQAPGSMYRLLFLDGELIGAVRRDPPSVIADGRSTVAALVRAENARRTAAAGHAGMCLIRPDLDFVLTLRAQGLTPQSVPYGGRRVTAKCSSSENAADENVTVAPSPLSPVVADAREAVRRLGLRFGGVDVVTIDLERDLRETGGAIIEVNGTPGLHYHYLVADPGAADRVAVPVLRALLGVPPRDRTGRFTRSRRAAEVTA